MTPLQVPAGLRARFDYHEHPRGISAVLTSVHTGQIVSVGFAKFSTEDAGETDFSPALGERIALGRALARRDRQPKTALDHLYPYVRRPAPGALDNQDRAIGESLKSLAEHATQQAAS
jgi:hypothetical protein